MFRDTSEFKEIDPDINDIDKLRKLKKGSNKQINWICYKLDCGPHRWITSIKSRTGKKSGCSICANRKICECKDKCNSFGYKNPDIAKEWNFINNKLTPWEVIPGSSKIVSWICKKSPCGGHKWNATIKDRVNQKSSCPMCTNIKICPCKDKCNSFGYKHPELIKEWDYKSNELSPFDYSSGSSKIVSWMCYKSNCNGHKWKVKISHRTGISKSKCPVCVNQKIYTCTNKCNSFGYKYTKLLNEWDYNKNKISPYDVFSSSAKKIWWICSKNHEWEAAIYHRTGNKSGCPICKESKGEKFVAEILNQLKINYKRQKTFEACVDEKLLPFDFYLPDHNLCIEYDGKQHEQPIEFFGGQAAFETRQYHDMIKDIFCSKEEYDIPLLRIKYNVPFNQIKSMIIDFMKNNL